MHKKKDASLAKGFQKHLSNDDCKHGLIDQSKDSRRAIKIKCTDREYHVQDNADVVHKYVKMYCDTNQFPTLPFFGSRPKHRGERGLGKHFIYVFIQI